jgi:hypothetical protein
MIFKENEKEKNSDPFARRDRRRCHARMAAGLALMRIF